jgi:hypothetical protein
MAVRDELVVAIAERYAGSLRWEKVRILDEFVAADIALYGYSNGPRFSPCSPPAPAPISLAPSARTAPRPSASPATPAAIDRRGAYRYEKADSLIISTGCRAYCCTTN